MKNKALLTGVLVLGAFAVGKAEGKKVPQSLQDQVIGAINKSNITDTKKEEQKQSVFRMSQDEIIILYRLFINHNGSVEALSTELRAAVRSINDKYNFF